MDVHRPLKKTKWRANNVHRPDADAHRRGAAAQPSQASPALCGGYASRKIERDVGCCDGYKHRASHLAVIVEAGYGRVCGDHHKGTYFRRLSEAPKRLLQ